MLYRTNYIVYKNGGAKSEYINKACFGGNKYDFNSKNSKKIKFFILKTYGDLGNNMRFSKEELQYLVDDLRSLGFNFKFYSGNVKDHYSKSKKIYKTGDSTDAYIFEFLTKNYPHHSSLLFILTILRYNYEGIFHNILREYFILRNDPISRRYGIIRCLQLAHYKGISLFSFGGHCIGYKHHAFKMITMKQFKAQICTHTDLAQTMLRGTPRKENISIRRDLKKNSIKHILKLLK